MGKHLRIVLLVLLLPAFAPVSAQPDTTQVKRLYVMRGVIVDRDTIPMVLLPDVTVYNLPDYKYLMLSRKYRRLVYNVKKAYPYAKIAGVRLKALDEQLATMKSEKAQQKYIDQAEKEIMAEFEQDIRHLTITQGQILVRLIDRETGRTSYTVIKDLKGGLTAFFWQGIARLFGNDLKTPYDPEGEDKVVEEIIMGIDMGFL
ncbi:MAG: DUF4294 domain-containing protein [Bacteroidota bacterium]